VANSAARVQRAIWVLERTGSAAAALATFPRGRLQRDAVEGDLTVRSACRPATERASVVLPDPDSPPTRAPWRESSRVMSCTTCCACSRETWSMERIGFCSRGAGVVTVTAACEHVAPNLLGLRHGLMTDRERPQLGHAFAAALLREGAPRRERAAWRPSPGEGARPAIPTSSRPPSGAVCCDEPLGIRMREA